QPQRSQDVLGAGDVARSVPIDARAGALRAARAHHRPREPQAAGGDGAGVREAGHLGGPGEGGAMNDGARRGRIVTFYSYKGGTGRSMLLANVAWILASNGKRVLVVDWDLEAPGLHRYFAPFLRDRELEVTDGVIDMLNDFAAEAVTPDGRAEQRDTA